MSVRGALSDDRPPQVRPDKNAQAIIQRIEYATLATVDEQGLPWNAPVYVAYDDRYNFYWGSYKDSQHSKNIRHENHVFLVIYNSTVKPGAGEGVYIRAQCRELSDPDRIIAAHALIQARREPIPYWKPEQLQGDTPVCLYQAVPEQIWMNASGQVNGTYIDTRIEAWQA